MYLTEEEIGAQKGLYPKTTQFKSCRARFQMKPSKRTGRILVYCSLIEKKKASQNTVYQHTQWCRQYREIERDAQRRKKDQIKSNQRHRKQGFFLLFLESPS